MKRMNSLKKNKKVLLSQGNSHLKEISPIENALMKSSTRTKKSMRDRLSLRPKTGKAQPTMMTTLWMRTLTSTLTQCGLYLLTLRCWRNCVKNSTKKGMLLCPVQ